MPRKCLRRLRELAVTIGRKLACAALLAAALLAGNPSASDAATANVIGGGFLIYAAAMGESNDVSLSLVGTTYAITDTGATIEPGTGCVRVTLQQVSCRQPDGDDSLLHFEIFVRDGNDRVTVITAPAGNSMMNKLVGEDGDDTLVGGPGNDQLLGLEGADSLSAGGGDDQMNGGPGPDALGGGGGRDLARYSDRAAAVTVTIDGTADDGNVEDGPPFARDNVATDVEDIQGGVGDDTLSGNGGANRLYGFAGSDMLDGGPGDDVLLGDQTLPDEGFPGPIGADTMIGGSGIDLVDYGDHGPVTVDLDGVADDGGPGEGDNAGTDVENIVGSAEADVLSGNDAANVLKGGGGDDELSGFAGDDVLDGGPGVICFPSCTDADVLRGGTGFDTADYGSHSAGVDADLDNEVEDDGEPGEGDTLEDFEGLSGGAGADLLIGDGQENVLSGGPGGDVLDGSLGADVLAGGPGFDAVDYSRRTAAVTVAFDAVASDGEAGEGDLVSTDMEDAYGGSGNDTLTGNQVDNLLAGGPGSDLIAGGAGNDFLLGEAGGDRLDGGADEDFYDAGADNDDVQSRDGVAEEVQCGDGTDSAVADGADETSDCEQVAKPAPIVATGPASSIGETEATLNGTVNPNGQSTSVYVEVGTTSAYGFRSSPTVVGAGVDDLAVSGRLSGLQGGVTYHYRYVAANPAGTSLGQDRVFTTLAASSPPPPVLPQPRAPRVIRCAVPNLHGKTLTAARKALKKAHCRAGKIKHAYSAKVKKGRIMAQKPRPRTRLANRAKVDLVVSRGTRKR
jgi:Ca2+-binding RTX toxin-like protein